MVVRWETAAGDPPQPKKKCPSLKKSLEDVDG